MHTALRRFVTAIDHVGIAVPDLDAAIAFYRDNFGLEVVHTESNEEQGVTRGDAARSRRQRHWHRHPAARPLTHGLDRSRKFIGRSGPGLQQLAYRVSDVDAAAEALRAKGLRLLYEKAKRGTSNSRVNFVHPKDAGGVLVELVEPARPD